MLSSCEEISPKGTFGDDALLRAVQGLLAPHFEPQQVRFEGGVPAYRHGLPGYAGAAEGDDLERAELILYGGGTQFFAFEAVPGQQATLPERIARAMSRPARIAESLRFRRRMRLEAGVAVMGVGLGFGPFVAGTTAEEAARAMAARMKFLWVRDATAEAFALGAGCSDVAGGADLCFLPEFQQAVLGGRGGTSLDGSPCVGIVLRDWPYDKEGRLSAARWIDVARRCRAAGLEAIFYSFSPNRDISLLRQLVEAGEEVCRWHPDQMTISDYASLLDRCQLLLTSRFHAAVFAVLLGKALSCDCHRAETAIGRRPVAGRRQCSRAGRGARCGCCKGSLT